MYVVVIVPCEVLVNDDIPNTAYGWGRVTGVVSERCVVLTGTGDKFVNIVTPVTASLSACSSNQSKPEKKKKKNAGVDVSNNNIVMPLGWMIVFYISDSLNLWLAHPPVLLIHVYTCMCFTLLNYTCQCIFFYYLENNLF